MALHSVVAKCVWLSYCVTYFWVVLTGYFCALTFSTLTELSRLIFDTATSEEYCCYSKCKVSLNLHCAGQNNQSLQRRQFHTNFTCSLKHIHVRVFLQPNLVCKNTLYAIWGSIRTKPLIAFTFQLPPLWKFQNAPYPPSPKKSLSSPFRFPFFTQILWNSFGWLSTTLWWKRRYT